LRFTVLYGFIKLMFVVWVGLRRFWVVVCFMCL